MSSTTSSRRFIVLQDMIDDATGLRGLGCSPDDGETKTVLATTKGFLFHQLDAKQLRPLLEQEAFNVVRLKSPGGTTYQLTVTDDGKIKLTKEGDSSDNTESTSDRTDGSDTAESN